MQAKDSVGHRETSGAVSAVGYWFERSRPQQVRAPVVLKDYIQDLFTELAEHDWRQYGVWTRGMRERVAWALDMARQDEDVWMVAASGLLAELAEHERCTGGAPWSYSHRGRVRELTVR